MGVCPGSRRSRKGELSSVQHPLESPDLRELQGLQGRGDAARGTLIACYDLELVAGRN